MPSATGDYILLITDQNLNILGNPVADWITLDCTLRFNEPGSGLFTAAGTPALREQLIEGARVVVMRYQPSFPDEDGQFVMAGPIEHILYERSDDGENAGDGQVTVNFSDDLASVVARLVYPDPTLAPEAQVTDAWTFSGNAETGLRTLVDYNAGPSALAARRVAQLALGTVAGAGTTVNTTADRMESLGAVARRMAISGGGLGFRTRQEDQQILFEVYIPEDKSTSVRFSFSLGNVKYLGYEQSAPTATAAIVGGQGEGADRFVTEVSDEDAAALWGRTEVLVSRAGTSTDLAEEGQAALTEGAATARLASNVADTPNQRYGTHYNLGDLVAIESWPGEQLVDTIVTVHIQAYATAGEIISATIGSQAASSDPKWLKRLHDIDDRVGRLERNVVPATP